MVALERLEGQRVDGEGVHAAPRELVPAPINAVAPGRFERSPQMYPSGAARRLIEQSHVAGVDDSLRPCFVVARGPK
tara:strand:- start:1690 stop:1920 length:231 start_codon:yes stop_codon:yes gene_type:complete